MLGSGKRKLDQAIETALGGEDGIQAKKIRIGTEPDIYTLPEAKAPNEDYFIRSTDAAGGTEWAEMNFGGGGGGDVEATSVTVGVAPDDYTLPTVKAVDQNYFIRSTDTAGGTEWADLGDLNLGGDAEVTSLTVGATPDEYTLPTVKAVDQDYVLRSTDTAGGTEWVKSLTLDVVDTTSLTVGNEPEKYTLPGAKASNQGYVMGSADSIGGTEWVNELKLESIEAKEVTAVNALKIATDGGEITSGGTNDMRLSIGQQDAMQISAVAGLADITPPLDAIETAYERASGAWSLRRLYSDYTGPSVQVSHQTDASLIDVPFGNNNQVDLSVLDGLVEPWYVERLYDQSGNARDLIGRAIALGVGGKKPRLILEVYQGGAAKPSILFDKSEFITTVSSDSFGLANVPEHGMYLTNRTNISTASFMWVVSDEIGTYTNNMYFNSVTCAGQSCPHGLMYDDDENGLGAGIGSQGQYSNEDYHVLAGGFKNGNNPAVRVNGNEHIEAVNAPQYSTTNKIVFGSRHSRDDDRWFKGYMSEWFILPTTWIPSGSVWDDYWIKSLQYAAGGYAPFSTKLTVTADQFAVNDYSFPTDKAPSAGLLLADTHGDGVLEWTSPTAGNPFDQTLNTADAVTFDGGVATPSIASTNELDLVAATVVNVPSSNLVMGVGQSVQTDQLVGGASGLVLNATANIDVISSGAINLTPTAPAKVNATGRLTVSEALETPQVISFAELLLGAVGSVNIQPGFGNCVIQTNPSAPTAKIALLSTAVRIGQDDLNAYSMPIVQATAPNSVITDVLGDGTLAWQAPPISNGFVSGQLGGSPQLVGDEDDEQIWLHSVQIEHPGSVVVDLANNTITLAAGGYYELSAIFGGFTQDDSLDLEIQWFNTTTASVLDGLKASIRPASASDRSIIQPHARSIVSTLAGPMTVHLEVSKLSGTPSLVVWYGTSQFLVKQL